MTMIEEVEAGVIRNVIHCNNRASEFVPWLPRSLHWRLLLRHPDAPRAKQVVHPRDHHAHQLPASNVRSERRSTQTRAMPLFLIYLLPLPLDRQNSAPGWIYSGALGCAGVVSVSLPFLIRVDTPGDRHALRGWRMKSL